MSDFITPNDPFGKILSHRAFSGLRRFILPIEHPAIRLGAKMMTPAMLQKIARTWNADDLVNGLNKFIEHSNNGIRVHHDVWSEKEKAANPSLKDTALFHFPVKHKSPFVLVCSGGGYHTVNSIVEGFPIAAELNRMGYSAFVLHYRTGEEILWPSQLEDLWKALCCIFDNAETLNVEPDQYAVAGFSAGGHLAASLGTDNFGYDCWLLPKPGALLLGYPVTLFDHMTKTHKQCRDRIIGPHTQPKYINAITITKHIDHDYPPTFVWHCRDDKKVHFENSEIFAQQLAKTNVPHIFKAVPTGGHGIALGNGTPAEGWLTEAVDFWQTHR